MDRNTKMVREYANRQDFATDEQLLSRQGWSVQSSVNQEERKDVLTRIRSFFTRATSESSFVVTYHRSNPS